MKSVSREVRISRFNRDLLSISIVGESWQKVHPRYLGRELSGIPNYVCTYTVTYNLDDAGEFIVVAPDGVAIRRVDPPTDDVLPVCFLPLDWAGRRVSIVRTNIRRTG